MPDDPRPLVRLITDAMGQFSGLIHSEMAVVRAEAGEKVMQAVTGAAVLLVAALLLIPTMVLALMAFAAWLVELGLRASLAHLSAAGVGLAVTVVLALFGKTRLDPDRLKFKTTAKEIERDADALRRVV